MTTAHLWLYSRHYIEQSLFKLKQSAIYVWKIMNKHNNLETQMPAFW